MNLKVNFVNLFVIPSFTSSFGTASAVKYASLETAIGYSPLHACLFGIVQTIVAGVLYNNLTMTNSRLADYMICHLLAGSALYALTAMAVKTGMLFSAMTLPGAAIVILAAAGSALVGKLTAQLIQKCFFPHHREHI